LNCPNCGAETHAGQKFCLDCGTPLAEVCPNCGQPVQAGARFCGECGTALHPSANGPAVATLEAALPAQSAARPSAAATAERRLVSVLFADLVGFTTLAEGRDAEAVRE